MVESVYLNFSDFIVFNVMFHSFTIFAAMKPHEIQEKLGLTRIRDRNWYVMLRMD